MTQTRVLVALLSILPASIRRRLVLALLRRVVLGARAPRRAPLRIALRQGLARARLVIELLGDGAQLTLRAWAAPLALPAPSAVPAPPPTAHDKGLPLPHADSAAAPEALPVPTRPVRLRLRAGRLARLVRLPAAQSPRAALAWDAPPPPRGRLLAA